MNVVLRGFNLNIAGYNIRVEAVSDGPDMFLSERFRGNVTDDVDSDVIIRVHSSTFDLPENATRVFHAPLFEEVGGVPEKKGDNFWSIYKNRQDLYIRTTFPMSGSDKTGYLKFSLTSQEWDLFLEHDEGPADPLDYPIDSLILYYLTVASGDIMLHASGVNNAGPGYVFSGVSGKGKTTIAKLWSNSGARVIHDDRLIIKRAAGEFRMHNTPVYRDDSPAESVINKIFLIEHGTENMIVPVKGANAVSLLLANCIQHNWNHEIIARLMGSVSMMCMSVPVFRLFFRPDRSIIDYMRDYE